MLLTGYKCIIAVIILAFVGGLFLCTRNEIHCQAADMYSQDFIPESPFN